MKIRDVVFGPERPQICLVLTNSDSGVLESEISQAIEQGVEVFEFRADLAFSEAGILDSEKPTLSLEGTLCLVRKLIGDRILIFTHRSKEEGGEGTLSLKEYEKINMAAGRTGLVDIIDLELEKGRPSIEEISKDLKEDLKVQGSMEKSLIQLSKHSLEGSLTKEDMLESFLRMQEFPPETVAMTKLAVQANIEKEALELMAAALDMREKFADRPYTAIAMGEKGKVSRIRAGFIGSALVFAKGLKSSAPGQMALEEVKKNYVKSP